MTQPDVSADPCVLVVGSANSDHTMRVEELPREGETVLAMDRHESPGGKGLNQAVAAARQGVRTRFLGAVGHDERGRLLEQALRRERVDVAHLQMVPGHPSGVAHILVGASGQNAIAVLPGANSEVELDPAAFKGVAAVVAQLEVPLDVVVASFRMARQVGAMTVLNPSPVTGLSGELVDLADIVVANSAEASALAIDPTHERTVVVTLGDRGAVARTSSGEIGVPGIGVRPIVDTTGAGDAFCGALVAELSRGTAIGGALWYANAAGALSVTRLGSVDSFPTREQTERLATTAPMRTR